MRIRWIAIALIATAAAVALVRSRSNQVSEQTAITSDSKLPDDIYVWQRSWTPEVVNAVATQHAPFHRLVILAGEILLKDSSVVTVQPKWAEVAKSDVAGDIRYLLGRRLARIGRWKEARTYFPPAVTKTFDDYIAAIRAGHDDKFTKADQAASFWKAAELVHASGMDLLGTELDPDYFCHGGSFTYDGNNPPFTDGRSKLTAPSDDERACYKTNEPDDDRRFHYRYIAAEHAWAAAQLMPDDTGATADVLYQAGCWLKDRDPKAADRFYKALVQRCPSTKIGKAAIAKRWFPAKA